ncbi:WD40 repeat-like protein [Cristinia sonorae]|uniref:WD40 repeat-like protein n=1 Tax=Cristinia sonorae TaxID=1940300 RepID=A0A8K0V075_9AGAR|nr:WD40 repeat-like protein [Cristinia sonorae]
MSRSDTDDEGIDDPEFDRTTEGDDDIEEDILDALEGDLAAAAEENSDADDDSDTDDSDNGSDDDGDPDERPPPPVPVPHDHGVDGHDSLHPSVTPSKPPSPSRDYPADDPPTPPEHTPRPLSPARARIEALIADLRIPKSYTVEAICAIPQPVPTHSLAASACMTHLLTGSDDGYIRDYDIFAAANGKVFLTLPQRQHCGVMEGLMKAAQLKSWWENPVHRKVFTAPTEDIPVCPPYSLLMHSDALWALSGSDQGNINLFTVRHEPGRLVHVMNEHRGPVSSLAMEHDQKGFFSAGWDGEAFQWDLNTGSMVRNFRSHGSQLTVIAVRPLTNFHHWGGPPIEPAFYNMNPPKAEVPPPMPMDVEQPYQPVVPAPPVQIAPPLPPSIKRAPAQDDDAKSDASFDPLFDDEPDADGEPDEDNRYGPPNGTQTGGSGSIAYPSHMDRASQHQRSVSAAAAPKNAPPVLDPLSYSTYSADVLMVASIDGQIVLWDKRVHTPGRGVGRLWMSDKTPPWCVSACWSADGGQIYAGRRNGTIDVYDVRQMGMPAMGTPRILKTLRNPASSGVVSCVVAFPDTRHIACASSDNIRLWNVAEANEPDSFGKIKSGVQFKIIPGHHGGFISQMLIDRAARFLVSASSNRGWFGESTRTIFVHEIRHIH